MACEIWHQHYFDILSFEQIEYMLNNFQSVNALKNQVNEGYEYYFIVDNNIYTGYLGIKNTQSICSYLSSTLKKTTGARGLVKRQLNLSCKEQKNLVVTKLYLQ